MSDSPLPRSPLLMNRGDTALLVVDLQERLLPHIWRHADVVWNVSRLVRGAQLLGVSVVATEQYPRGLGPTTGELRELLAPQGSVLPEKTMFSCRECTTLVDELVSKKIANVVLTGIETHVCVLQTALDFLSFGFNVYVVVDAVSSRFEIDRDVALRRLENSGVIPTTTEAALFEWCEKAGSPEFKQISKLAQETLETRGSVG